MRIISAKSIDSGFNIAIVVSRFNYDITKLLYEGAVVRLRELGFHENQITVVWVPGAIEIPLIVKKLAQQGRYQAILALGAVIRGETTHYDYVCEQVSDGCANVMLEYNLPIIFGVLTTENIAQAKDRLGGRHGHKGRDAVDAAYEMVSVIRQMQQLGIDDEFQF